MRESKHGQREEIEKWSAETLRLEDGEEETESKRRATSAAEDQRDKCSSADPAAPVSNGRSGRLKPWPEFLRSLNAGKLIWCCHNKQPGDGHFQLLLEKRSNLKKK